MPGMTPPIIPPGPGAFAGGSFVPPPFPGFCASTVATTVMTTSKARARRGKALSCAHAALSGFLIAIAASMP